MERKLVQIGKSLAVTLPVEVVRQFRLRKGQSVDVSVHPLTGAVTVRAGVTLFDGGRVTKRFRSAAEGIRQRYDDAFRKLSK